MIIQYIQAITVYSLHKSATENCKRPQKQSIKTRRQYFPNATETTWCKNKIQNKRKHNKGLELYSRNKF